MIELRNDCVGCETCYGYCSKRGNYEVIMCDDCGEDVERAIVINGKQFCEECAIEYLLNTYGDRITFEMLKQYDCECVEDFSYLELDTIANALGVQYEIEEVGE